MGNVPSRTKGEPGGDKEEREDFVEVCGMCSRFYFCSLLS